MKLVLFHSTRRVLLPIVWCIPFFATVGFFLYVLEFNYPQVGPDFIVFFRYLTAGKWHFLHQGIAPFRYAVHLCGGMPMYGNPNDIFYSVTQLLSLFLDPWRAVEGSVVFYLLLGYFGWYRLGRDVMRLSPAWTHVLAVVTLLQGFLLFHIVIGHLNFFPFPLIGLLLWLLLEEKSKKSMPLLLRASLFALLSAGILYAAGYFVLLFTGILFLLLCPALFLLQKDVRIPSFSILLTRLSVCAAFSALLLLSRITAVWSLMQFFTRETDMVSVSLPLSYAIRALWGLPQTGELFSDVPWAFHEQTMFLSPLTIVGLPLALFWIFVTYRKKHSWRALVLVPYFGLLLLLCNFLIAWDGPVAAFLGSLPILSSLHVTLRFLSIFALLVALLSVFVVARLVQRFHPQAEVFTAVFAIVWTLGAAYVAYKPMLPKLWLGVDAVQYKTSIRELEQAGVLTLPVTFVQNGDTDFHGNTGLQCSGDAFFVWAGQPQSTVLVPGSVATVRDGYFNLMNPACYAYPKANRCSPGDRIALADSENFERFRNGQPTTWRVSPLQRVADGISFLTFLFVSGTVLYGYCRIVSRQIV